MIEPLNQQGQFPAATTVVDPVFYNAVQSLIGASNAPILTQGNVWWVRPATGSDSNNGQTSATAFKTLAAALSAATANQNDIVLLCAESNTASGTTDYQSATLNWNKNLVHLLGVNDGPALSQRSRIAFASTYNTASNLFTLSASDCLIANVAMFMGIAGTNPLGGMLVTGQRNVIRRCHIAGIGNAANDIAGAYSLNLSGAEENVFEDCVIGLDTVPLSAQANSQILITANVGVSATRNLFRNCMILQYAAHATNPLFLRAAATTIDRWLRFHDCIFSNPVQSGATALTHAFSVAAAAGGTVMMTGASSGYFGATNLNATSAADIFAATGVAPDATAFAKAVAITSNG